MSQNQLILNSFLIKERAELLSKPTDDIMTEFMHVIVSMGYTEEKNEEYPI